MRLNINTLFIALFSFLLLGSVQSCKSDKKTDVKEAAENAAENVEDAAKEVADEVSEGAEAVKDEAMEGMESLGTDLGFEEGSWSYNVQQSMSTGGTETFVLDKVPFEGEELTAEADAQLNDLAAILKANPNARIVIKGHTKEAKNAVGRNAKKATSKARALWVQTKLSLKGATGDQMRARGMADEELMEGVPGDDDSQSRITITLGTKDSE